MLDASLDRGMLDSKNVELRDVSLHPIKMSLETELELLEGKRDVQSLG